MKSLTKKLKEIRDKYYFLNYGEKSITSFLKESSYRSVLDIGCGKGRDLLLSKKYANSDKVRLFGVDLQEDKNNIEGVEIFKLNIEKEKLPFLDETFDIVIANQVLEHVKEIFWVSNEICRVLKRNGRFIIGVPNLAALHNRILLLFGKHPTCIKTSSAHVRGFTIDDLLIFYEKIGGLKNIAIKGENIYPFPPFISTPLSSLFPNIAVSIFLLFEKTEKYQNNFIEYLKQNQLETPFFNGEN